MIKQGLPIVKKHKVVVLTITYNHSKYIEDTLRGFAMQQTDFPFLCCVFDDASTDGEQQVLKRWVEKHCNSEEVEVYDHSLTVILKAPDKNNPNCIYVMHLQKVNTWGKPEKRELLDYWRQFGEYQALCEGDDYWIDPLKLQKQVDFLDSNKNYGLVHTNYKCFYQKNKVFVNNKNKKGDDNETLESLLNQNTIATLTCCFRTDIYNKIPKYYASEGFRMGDYPMWLEIAAIAKIKYLPEITSVYRFLENSASHPGSVQSQLLFNIDTIRVREFYVKKYNFLSLLSETRKELLYWNAVLASVRNERMIAIKLFIKSKQFELKKTLRFFKYWLFG